MDVAPARSTRYLQGMHERLLVCVTFHYVAARLVWLRQVLECLCRYDMPIRLIVLTNAVDDAEIADILQLVPPSESMHAECRSIEGLADPFELTWSHKPIIANDFLAGDHTHFVYVEDDILIAPEAFAYWRQYRAHLARRGLVPGFLRVEREPEAGVLFATDQMRHTQLDRTRMVRVGPWTFTNVDSPYTGSFILDRELAEEYTASRSFSITGSLAVKPNWAIRERAAMGLCFERVPRFFWSRLAVPFEPATLRIPAFAHVIHAPANYAKDPASHLAKIPVDAMLLKPDMRLFIRDRSRTARRLLKSSLRKIIGHA